MAGKATPSRSRPRKAITLRRYAAESRLPWLVVRTLAVANRIPLTRARGMMQAHLTPEAAAALDVVLDDFRKLDFNFVDVA